ncbi:TetR/AcrR family transcriptional regulator [Brevibacillus daliensis]|uniref:TetR/AcrR family transcriptional regulator n=1 Tax=Brevibacillus daliensis TaxID=2892995 RepID=UPI001E39BCCF|nr:TetR/AcrR family transcriptional regulator [Brevibacillus daliensis]
MKERIVQAAIKEMMHRGLKFSIRDIAHGLGISTKTIYQYFDSKEQIISHIVVQSIEEMREAEMGVMLDSSLSIKQKLHKALVIIPSGFAFRDIRILQELKIRYPDQWRAFDEYDYNGWDRIRLLVKEGIAKGDIRAIDMELFIHVYIGALYHLMDSQIAGRLELSFERALDQMVEMLLVGIYK